MLDRRAFLPLLAATSLLCASPSRGEGKRLIVFAAASLKEALERIGAGFRKETGSAIAVSVAGSGQLAQQIAAGAPADVFFSADERWMDWLAERDGLRAGTRRGILGNALVLIVPEISPMVMQPKPGFPIAAMLGTGRLAMGDPRTVPAGRYAKQALEKLGVWEGIASKIAATDNVRAALALVSRGECDVGIVYATDAKADPSVRVAGVFPPESHDPIVYPVAVTKASTHPNSGDFIKYLQTGEAQQVFRDAGFIVPA
jgi:molybdate transport system substrate-binding protein